MNEYTIKVVNEAIKHLSSSDASLVKLKEMYAEEVLPGKRNYWPQLWYDGLKQAIDILEYPFDRNYSRNLK